MERRRLMFLGLASALTTTLGLAATAKAGVLGDTSGLARSPTPDAVALDATDAEMLEDGIQLAQYGPGRNRRRRPRCWNETRNVRYRDRWGRMRTRQVTQRVCR